MKFEYKTNEVTLTNSEYADLLMMAERRAGERKRIWHTAFWQSFLVNFIAFIFTIVEFLGS